jgi:hypothetical protein
MTSIISRIINKISKILSQPAVTPPNPVVVAQAAVRRLGEDHARIGAAEELLLQLKAQRAESARLNAEAIQSAIGASRSDLQRAEAASLEEIDRAMKLSNLRIALLEQLIQEEAERSIDLQLDIEEEYLDFRQAREAEIAEAQAALDLLGEAADY